MNSDEVFDSIQCIARLSGKRDKEQLVKDCMKDELFAEVMKRSLDPFVTYGVQQIPDVDRVGNEGCKQLFDRQTFALLDDLAERKLTGTAAQNAIAAELLQLSDESGMLLARIIKKDLRAGFSASTVNKAAPGTIYVFKCMLSHKFEPHRIKEWPVAVEPKYDGVRCLAIMQDGVVKFYSRTGKEFTNFYHLGEELLRLIEFHPKLPSEGAYIFDGEIMSGEFNKTVGDVHKKEFQALDAQFYCFDFMALAHFKKGGTPLAYSTRRAILEQIIVASRSVKLPPVTYCANLDEIMFVYESVREKGGEGVIVKPIKGGYEAKRSHNWMKIKDCVSVDLPIVGFEEGTGKFEDSLGALVVDYKGKHVRVGSGLTDFIREMIWSNRDEYLNKIVEVQYHEETPDGSLRHPRYIGFRIDKTVEDGIGV